MDRWATSRFIFREKHAARKGNTDGGYSRTTRAAYNSCPFPSRPPGSPCRTSMSRFLTTTFALVFSCAAVAQSSSPLPTASPQIVEVQSGAMHLKAYFWKPSGAGPFPAVLFNHGSGAADAQHTAGQTMAEAAANLAPIFLKHGYAFFYLCRRGQGLSADQAPFMQDLLKREEAAKGKEARQHLHYVLVTGEQLDDSLAEFRFLKTAVGIDPRRIAVIGHSFGGVITLLSGERDEPYARRSRSEQGPIPGNSRKNFVSASSRRSARHPRLSC